MSQLASGGLVDPTVVEQIWREFADLGRLQTHAIDITTETAPEIADLVIQRLRAGQLACGGAPA
jgi:hypothetical protein